MRIMRTLCFGEILWDIIGGQPYIGGAPFNLAAHLARMGASSYFISAVGEDELGSRALTRAAELGVATDYIVRHPGRATGTVDVRLSETGQPDYTIHEPAAWDDIVLRDGTTQALAAAQWDFFCFGTLAQRSEENRASLAQALKAARPREVVYDVNLRQHFFEKAWIDESLKVASIVKLNAQEADLLGAVLFGEELNAEDFCNRIGESFDVRIISLTEGADGASVWVRGSMAWVPGVEVAVADTVGAGDAFTAGFIFALDAGKSPVEATRIACRVGAWVASCRSAVPDYTDEITSVLEDVRREQMARQSRS